MDQPPFQLDERLAADCVVLGELDLGLVLLMNNARVPWFILVPRTDVTELCDLRPGRRQQLFAEVDALSRFVRTHFNIDKLNVAAIGNVVSQMHVHVVGRRKDDWCWPGVVWGAPGAIAYEEAEIERIKTLWRER